MMADDGMISQWSDLASHSLRAKVRGMSLSMLAASQSLAGSRSALRRPRVQVLILHHVFPDEEAAFSQLLERLSRDHTFIGYSEAVRRAQAGGDQVDRPYLALTFDDGFKNCLRAAAIMNEHGAKGCFFVCPSIVGETDRAKIRSFCLDRLELPGWVEFMDWNDLESLRDAGHDIGGHTMTHPHLTRLSASQARDEISHSFESIANHLGEVRHFAWTYGGFDDFSAELAQMVCEAGYQSCASGVRGCHGPARSDGSTPLCVRRDHIVAGWPLNHCLYFLTNSSRSMSAHSGAWPAGWTEIIHFRTPHT